jgi:hypothetical protein
LYAIPPKLIFDKKNLISHKYFFEKYALCNFGISPKNLKIGKKVEESNVEALFEPYILRNGYKYSFSDNEKFISNVETLWMVTHQKTQVSNTRLINKVEA